LVNISLEDPPGRGSINRDNTSVYEMSTTLLPHMITQHSSAFQLLYGLIVGERVNLVV